MIIIKEISYGERDIREWISAELKKYHKNKYGEESITYFNGKPYHQKDAKGA